MLIGLDFDNTIICYDHVFLAGAKEQALLPPNFTGTKRDVRDAIRLLPDGETRWQALQGYVYGRGIGGATPFDGLPEFLARVQSEGHTVVIVSHKTEFGHFDPTRVNLREAALDWMRNQRFFSTDGYGLSETNVHFASTRADKLQKIRMVECEIFVDDLEEVLGDPDFPTDVEPILFSSDPVAHGAHPFIVLPTWSAIEDYILDRHVRT